MFLPLAIETLGGLQSGAIAQVKQLAAVLAQCKGVEEGADFPLLILMA